ncbi:MAG: DUF2259 domain-containing protein [Alphaproteobacteria bacterium]|nr:DUF2259 domain-containing protein [Alphaproteobacteria bacterium]
MLRLMILVLALVLGAAPGLAADGAQSRALGYSADGKYFAFEQFGVQDGSGFPYWDVFVLDLAANDWVKGTPVRILVEDEEQRLPEARRQAMAKAQPVIERLAITEPADLLLANPFTEAVPDRTRVRFGIFHNTMEPPYELSVSNVELPAPDDCTDPDFKPYGMELMLKVLTTGKSVTIARDESIPKSRLCPLRYDIEAIYTPSGFGNPGHQVALVGVYSRGFEGENRRIIAVPFTLPNWEN